MPGGAHLPRPPGRDDGPSLRALRSARTARRGPPGAGRVPRVVRRRDTGEPGHGDESLDAADLPVAGGRRAGRGPAQPGGLAHRAQPAARLDVVRPAQPALSRRAGQPVRPRRATLQHRAAATDWPLDLYPRDATDEIVVEGPLYALALAGAAGRRGTRGRRGRCAGRDPVGCRAGGRSRSAAGQGGPATLRSRGLAAP